MVRSRSGADPTSVVRFDRFVFDRREARLLDGSTPVPLTPKAFALLETLLERSGSLITKDELLDRVWPDTHVSEGVLKTCIAELRAVLGDDASEPRFIETVHRRGYRFLVKGETADGSELAEALVVGRKEEPTLPVVGRDTELAQLERHLEAALAGRRQLVFVTGEAGIGKTMLVDSFLERSAAAARVRVAHGQCIEQYGAGEAYLPVLEALGRLCRGSDQTRTIELLGRYAPKWLAQMPWLVEAADRERLERDLSGANRQRMLRELTEFLEAFSAEQPLVVVLEDLHWSDFSTVELLSVVARRSERARVLILGTYRPAELIVVGHPLMALKRDLGPRRQCHELALDLLSSAEIDLYLSRRFPDGTLPAGLAGAIHARTDGHPLFMASVVDYAIAEGVIEGSADLGRIEADVPDSLREMIDRQIDALSPDDREALRAASVAGVEFSTAAVASAVGRDPVETEQRFEELARQGRFVRSKGVSTWPDGAVAGRYAFLHALFRDVPYHGLSDVRRLRFHRRIGERLEHVYGDRAGEIAAELALHFEEARNAPRAVHYLRQAGANASRRFASVEAIRYLGRAIELLATLPDTPDRAREELALQTLLGTSWMAVGGYAAGEVERCFARARELCRTLGDPAREWPVLTSLAVLSFVRANFAAARALGDELAAMSPSPYGPIIADSHLVKGWTALWTGDFEAARDHSERYLLLSDPAKQRSQVMTLGQDSAVTNLHCLALALWFLGRHDEALRTSEAATARARALSHPFTLAFSLAHEAWLREVARETEVASERAEEAMALSTDGGFVLWATMAGFVRGWSRAEQGRNEGIAEMENALEGWGATGARVFVSHMRGRIAEARARRGESESARALLERAIRDVEATGERWCEAELRSLREALAGTSRAR